MPGECLFQAGDAYPIFNMNGINCGINICYDTNFPEAAHAVAAQGARVLLVPSQEVPTMTVGMVVADIWLEP